MEKEEILQLLYQKYILPTEAPRKGYIGVEIEMPIVNLNKAAVDFDVVHQLTAAFLQQFSFHPAGIDDEGHIYSAVNDDNGDVFSYDCSYNNLELSFGRETDLNAINDRFAIYYRFIQAFFEPFHYTLTGMGINPYRACNHHVPIPNGRYKMLYHHLSSFTRYQNLPMYFHRYPQFGMFSSASQVQLDVTRENVAQVIDVFNRLEPIKALLFSNSVLLGENEQLLCCRDMLWENSTHGVNPHNIGMYDCSVSSVEELLQYLSTTAVYCVERDGKYLNFPPVSLPDYFNRKTIEGEYSEHGEIRRMTFTPQKEDIAYLRTFKFEDLTFRGTVEFRSACCQPIADVMSVAAFHVGLLHHTEELDNLLREDTSLYHNGYTAAELRRQLVQSELPSYLDKDALYRLAEQILDICAGGLRERGKGEEVFLHCLYDRVRQRTNPAAAMLARLAGGESQEALIKDYAKLKN